MNKLILEFVKSIKSCYSIKRFADWDGRTGRRDYRYFALFIILVSLAEMLVTPSNTDAFRTGLFAFTTIFEVMVSILTTIPFIAIAGRRLHDINLSAGWVLILLAPVLNLFVLFFLLSAPSYPGETRFEATKR